MDVGLIYVIVAELLYASEIIFIKKFFPTTNVFFLSAIGSIIGSLFYLPVFFIVKEKLSINNWAVILIYAFTSWFLAQIFYVTGVQKSTNAFNVSLAVLMLPLGTLILSMVFLKENISFKSVIGGLLMISGFFLVAFK